MKKILILEDDQERIKFFKRKLFNQKLFIFDNVDKAKECLEKEEIDILFLDHDLDNRVYVDSKEDNTGYQFAVYVANTKNKYEQIIIHSMNIVGSTLMEEVLKKSSDDVRRIPFHLLVRLMD